jgi:hypothetical protein
MKYLFFVLVIIVIQSFSLQAQSKTDTIRVKHSDYFIGEKEYDTGEIEYLLKMNSASADYINSSGTYNTLGWCSLTLGVLLTYSFVSDTYHDVKSFGYVTTDKRFYLFGGSAIAVDILTVLFFSSSSTYFNKAIRAYNRNIKSSSSLENEFQLNFSLNKITLNYRF